MTVSYFVTTKRSSVHFTTVWLTRKEDSAAEVNDATDVRKNKATFLLMKAIV